MRTHLLLFVVAAAVCQAADFVEPSTGMIFPEKCGAWTRKRIDQDPRKEVGTSVGYSIHGGSAVTCRIYDGQFGSPSDNPVGLKKELDEIAAGVPAVWERMGARVELALPVGPLRADSHQYVVGHRIHVGEMQSISITMLQFRHGRYLSFRFTTPTGDGTEAFNELGRFFAALQTVKPPKPNQSLEPTPTAGTSAAEPPRVPAAVVAHL